MLKEVPVAQAKELLRRWLAADDLRRVSAGAGVDRETARRYIDATVGWRRGCLDNDVQNMRSLPEGPNFLFVVER